MRSRPVVDLAEALAGLVPQLPKVMLPGYKAGRRGYDPDWVRRISRRPGEQPVDEGDAG